MIQYGLGGIGIACARAVASTEGLCLVGAVDVDPAKVGKPIADVIAPKAGKGSGMPPRRLRVAPTLARALRGARADVVIHTTQSSLSTVYPQIRECLEAGLPVVSSTEELALPFVSSPTIARRLDKLARRCKAAVLGTGVNPGFVMDLVPIVASGASRDVKKITIRRRLDVASRRLSFQKKVGVGMEHREAARKLEDGSMGHVGLIESAFLVATACGLRLDQIKTSGKPITASKPIRSALGMVPAGRVIGFHQVVSGRCKRRETLRLEMVMALGAPEPGDEAVIEGNPPLRLRFDGGVPGDAATIATLVNAVPRALAAPAGLHTMLDLPIPHTWSPGIC